MKPLLVTFILFFVLTISGQISTCTTCYSSTQGNTPNIRGLKLGMSITEVERILGMKIILENETTSVSLDKKPYKMSDKPIEIDVGVKKFYFSSLSKFSTFNKISTPLEDIEILFLYFFNNSIYKIHVKYSTQDFKWSDNKEFVAFLSEKFNLPEDTWDIIKICDDYEIGVDVTNGKGTISLIDVKTDSEISAKARRIVEDKKKNFKP